MAMAGNPLVVDDVRITILLRNPTAGGQYARSFPVKDIYYEVVGPDGQRYDFAHSGRVTIPTGGYSHTAVRKFPLPGTYQGRPIVVTIKDAQKTLGPKTFAIAEATVTPRYDDDGSVWAVTSYTDARPSTSVLVEGPPDIDLPEISFT